MSMKYLGEQIDIHAGGMDLVFPHHENEIAQSESFTGKKPFVKYWMHNGLLRLGEAKMSKSLGNLITIREALVKHSADAIRIFILGSYYRAPLTFTEEALEAAEKGADRLRQVAQSKAGGDNDIWCYHIRYCGGSGYGCDADALRVPVLKISIKEKAYGKLYESNQ